jgi:uncharacterized protein YndB with AHSA1/START domain
MENAMNLHVEPAAKTGMLIRRPAAEVFEAFVDPAITSKFWFSKGSARLTAGAQLRWDWEMYGVSAQVEVKTLEPARRIVVDWGWPGEPPTTIEWSFEPRGEDQTMVTVANSGFRGTGDEVVAQALDSQEGFSLSLAGAKAWLEHGIQLNLVPDRHPDALVG